MKHIILGTAGHIDHGKTLLTKVLTGVDCDRLEEEKKRGITIELGFAPLKLSKDVQVSIVDVPGHERFIKNMMAGASGIDGVLLTIACDDGVMPQTREHLNIIRLLHVTQGIIVLTKSDLADEARIEEVKKQVRALVRGTELEYAPVVPVSAMTKAGIPELKEEIRKLVDSLQEKSVSKPGRLPVDRAFPVSGFGNVVTGTLTEGTFQVNQEIQIYPGEERGQIRSLQHHNKNVEEVAAGGRTAMSFKGLDKVTYGRGDTIAEPDSMITAKILDVRVQITNDAPYKIKNSSQMHLFHGTKEIVCKIRLLEADLLTAGQTGYAQLFLAEPISFRIGDPFILRFFSPILTVGGGVILAHNEYRQRRKQAYVLDRFKRLESTDRTVAVEQLIMDAGLNPINPEVLRKTMNISEAEYDQYINPLYASSAIRTLNKGGVVSKAALDAKLELIDKWLRIYQKKYPLQPGMDIAQLRGRVEKGESISADSILEIYIKDGILKMDRGHIATADFTPVFTQEHKIMQRKLLHYYKDAWLKSPNQRIVDEKFTSRGIVYKQVLPSMKLTGKLIPITKSYSLHHEAYRAALEILVSLCERDGYAAIATFRDAADISRKYSQMYLEYWDKIGVTRRRGDVHELVRTREELLPEITEDYRNQEPKTDLQNLQIMEEEE